MIDPVLAEDGNTYERTEILDWAVENGTSPMDAAKKMADGWRYSDMTPARTGYKMRPRLPDDPNHPCKVP